MILILVFLLIFLFGFVVVDKYTNSLSLLEKFFSGIIVGTCLYIICTFLLASILKNTFYASLIINIFFILLLIPNFNHLLKLKAIFVNLNRQKWFLTTLLVFFLIFSWQYPQVLLKKSNLGWHVGRNTFGDTQIHMGIINSFVYSENFPPNNPFYLFEPLNYYFLTDFLSSIIVSYNYSQQLALLAPSLIYSLVLVVLLVLLIKRLKGNNTALFLGPLLFLFNGGLGFIYFFQDNKNQNLIKALLSINKEYTHLWDKNIQFTNMIGGFLAPERPLILGIPIFLVILILLHSQIRKKRFNNNLFFASIATIILPVFHLYFYLTTVFCMFIYALIDMYYCQQKLKKWFFALSLVFLGTLPQIIPIFIQISNRSFLNFNFGWMLKPGENFFIFWFKNLGIAPLLVLFFLLSSKTEKRIKLLFLPFIFLFIILNLFSFQPYVWDNVKLLIPIHLASSIFIALGLERLLTKNFLYKLVALITIVILILSGVISYIGETQANYLLFSNDELKLAEFIKKNTIPIDVFLSQPIHNSPIACLAGRSILMGYQGYLWTQGIDYKEREVDIIRLLNSVDLQKFKTLAGKYDIAYVVLDLQNKKIPVNYDFFHKNFVLVYQNKKYQIFKLNN